MLDRALHDSPDIAPAVREDHRKPAPRLKDPVAFAEGIRENLFVPLRRRVIISIRRNHGLTRAIRELAEPRLLEEIHVAVEDVAPEGRIGEDVVHTIIMEMRQVRGRSEMVRDRSRW